jgi:glycosyltransferase involved in cell wall biosynthesis
MLDISIVIPVYNEANNIEAMYAKLSTLLESMQLTYEIVFVDDGSDDGSIGIIQKLCSKNRSIVLIKLTRNFGHQAALTAGMDNAGGKMIITMDCDFQDPPELIPEMIEAWKNGALVVFARRKIRNDPFFKRSSAQAYYYLLEKFSDIKITGNIGDYRLIDKSVLNELGNMKEKSRYLRGMISWLGFNYTIIDFERPKRNKGKSKFSLLKMIRLGMDGILNFSLLPLRLGLVLGLIIIPIGLFFLIYIAVDTLVNQESYPLYKWISVLSFTLIGFLFVLIWILGEYIGKIFNESRNRPIYVIAEKVKANEASSA